MQAHLFFDRIGLANKPRRLPLPWIESWTP
jgi:hypothetical protein